jgi:hypothetical protein
VDQEGGDRWLSRFSIWGWLQAEQPDPFLHVMVNMIDLFRSSLSDSFES